MDNVQKETHAVSVMTDKHKETCAVVRDAKDDRLLPHQIRRPKTDEGGENPQKQAERKALQTKGSKFRAVTKIVRNRHVDFGILLCVKTTSLRPIAFSEENVSSDMLRLRRRPAKKSKKYGAKGSVALLKESYQLGCVSQDSYPRKFIVYSAASWKIGIKTRRQILQGLLAKKRKERVHREELSQSVNLMSVVFARQNSRKYHMKRPCTKKDAPAV